jgi:hypothetical protein
MNSRADESSCADSGSEFEAGAIQSTSARHRNAWLVLAIAAWVVAIGFGWWTVAAYEFRHEPAEMAVMFGRWPVGSALTLAADRPTMLFFMHPKCPCTRASLAELERLWFVQQQRDAKRAPKLVIVVTAPADAAVEWIASDTVVRARALEGALFCIDRDGHEARRFGAATSGMVKWFDRAGTCLYSGGITASRGHEGDNAGREGVESLLAGVTHPVPGLPAFGCRLCLPPRGSMP